MIINLMIVLKKINDRKCQDMLECFETQQETLFVQESLSAHATQIWAREVVTSGTLKISTKVHFHFRIVVNIKCFSKEMLLGVQEVLLKIVLSLLKSFSCYFNAIKILVYSICSISIPFNFNILVKRICGTFQSQTQLPVVF